MQFSKIFNICLWSTIIFPRQFSMPMSWIPWLSFPPSSSSPLHQITTSCSLKFHDLVTYSLKIFLLSLVCGPFQFVLKSVALLSFFFVEILPIPSFIHFTDHFLCNPWLSGYPLDSPKLNHSQSLRHTIWYCPTTNPQSHFHIRLQRVFLLNYLALSVAGPGNTNPSLVFAFSSLRFSSI